jgi:hypothetical protein
MYSPFHKDLFRYSKIDRGDSQTHRYHSDLINLLLFFQNKESRLKMSACKGGGVVGQQSSWTAGRLIHLKVCNFHLVAL